MFQKKSRLFAGFALAGMLLAGSQLTGLAQVSQPSLSLLNMAKFYSGLPQQDSALLTLQRQIDSTSPELLRADSIASNVWRNTSTLIGHEDILSQISAANRVGTDPVSMAIAVASPAVGAPLNLEVIPLDGVESPSRVMVTLDRGGFLDDSVAGDRHRFDMSRQNGQWTITRAGRQIRCQQGRGHQDYSTALCS